MTELHAVSLYRDVQPEELDPIETELQRAGFQLVRLQARDRLEIVAIPERPDAAHSLAGLRPIEAMPGVDGVRQLTGLHPLAGRANWPTNTIVRVGDAVIGGNALVVMAGPCSVEGLEQVVQTARAVKAAGARVMRGGAFKPRTSPYTFQGLGEEGLELLAESRELTGLPIVTEVMSPNEVELVERYADILQIGARNMQNFPLLREVGRASKPVLLKRGLSATLEELVLASEYVLVGGQHQVILCERGIRTFETAVRNTLDLSAVPVLKSLTHLPVIVDPSHAAGKRSLVTPLALAAAACGADGLIIEVHPDPDNALSDGPQSLNLAGFAELMRALAPVASAVGRSLSSAATGPDLIPAMTHANGPDTWVS